MEVLMSKLDSIFREMQMEMAKALLVKIKSGEATAAELNVARQLLKDNNIDTVPKEGDPMHNLVHTLPFTGDDDEDRPPVAERPYRN